MFEKGNNPGMYNKIMPLDYTFTIACSRSEGKGKRLRW